jgi:hypothetical protein
MYDLSSLSTSQNILLASIGSTIEALSLHPTTVIKNNIQSGRKISFQPKKLYTGLSLGATCGILATSIQYASFSKVQKYINNTFASSIISGCITSMFVSPIEMGIVLKNKHFFANYSYIFKLYKNRRGLNFLTCGFLSTCSRESFYAFGLFFSTPLLEKYLNIENNTIKSITASVLSGIVSTTLSHPFDTIKTIQQFHICDKYDYKQLNIKKLYAGVSMRMFRNCSCFFILNESNKFFIHYI